MQSLAAVQAGAELNAMYPVCVYVLTTVVDKFETKKEAEKNLTRRPYYPLDVLYYIRANEWNLNRILGDYELPHVPLGQDCFERCFPWLFPKEVRHYSL